MESAWYWVPSSSVEEQVVADAGVELVRLGEGGVLAADVGVAVVRRVLAAEDVLAAAEAVAGDGAAAGGGGVGDAALVVLGERGLEVARGHLTLEGVEAGLEERHATVLDLEGHAVRELVAEHQAEVDELLVGLALVAQAARDALAGRHGAARALVQVVAAGLAEELVLALVAGGVLPRGARELGVEAVVEQAVLEVEVADGADGVRGLGAGLLLVLAALADGARLEQGVAGATAAEDLPLDARNERLGDGLVPAALLVGNVLREQLLLLLADAVVVHVVDRLVADLVQVDVGRLAGALLVGGADLGAADLVAVLAVGVLAEGVGVA